MVVVAEGPDSLRARMWMGGLHGRVEQVPIRRRDDDAIVVTQFADITAYQETQCKLARKFDTYTHEY
jgi:hypothetical protein